MQAWRIGGKSVSLRVEFRLKCPFLMSMAEKAAAGRRKATAGRAAWIMTVMDGGPCVILPCHVPVKCPIPTEVRWGKESLPSGPAGRRRAERVTGGRQSGSLTDGVERRLRRHLRFSVTTLENEQWQGLWLQKASSPSRAGGVSWTSVILPSRGWGHWILFNLEHWRRAFVYRKPWWKVDTVLLLKILIS